LKIALDIASALSYLHNFDPPIIHRDVRSPNILIVSLEPDSKTFAKLGDFGLSQTSDLKLTEPLSTWQWLSPEVLNAESISYDESMDTFSFAIVLYELLSRLPPYSEVKC